jgi:hypothetical protein
MVFSDQESGLTGRHPSRLRPAARRPRSSMAFTSGSAAHRDRLRPNLQSPTLHRPAGGERKLFRRSYYFSDTTFHHLRVMKRPLARFAIEVRT